MDRLMMKMGLISQLYKENNMDRRRWTHKVTKISKYGWMDGRWLRTPSWTGTLDECIDKARKMADLCNANGEVFTIKVLPRKKGEAVLKINSLNTIERQPRIMNQHEQDHYI